MVELGAACLIAAPFACAYAAIAAIVGARRNDRRLVDSSRRAIYALCALLTVCVVVLEAAFVRSDFSVQLVAEHSSTTTPLGYKLTAMWSSQGGSLLLWAWVLSIASSGVLYLTRSRHREVVPWATAVLAGHRPLLRCADAARARRQPVRPPRPGPDRGRRPQPAAAAPGDGDPPADALLGLRAVVDPVRVRDRRADHPPARRELDPPDAPLRAGGLDPAVDRDPARQPLELLGARLGRLLGVGRGRERLADALARRHRLPALGDGPGEARDAEGVERVADRGYVHARAARDLPGALGDPRVDPRVRRLDRRPVAARR